MSLDLYSATWRLPDEEQVAFSFAWPNCSSTRRASNSTFRPRTCSSREINYSTGFGQGERDDPDPSCPIWKYIRLEEFHGESGFDLDSFAAAIIDGFRGLMEVEPLIEDAFRYLPEKPLPAPKERRLRTIAFLDTECDGSGIERRLTELAIVNVAYDVDGDEVVGLLDEYCMGRGEKLDEPKARSVLERAEFTVAHNRFSPTLLAGHLPGTEGLHWLCSFREIAWKQVLGIQSESLEALMGKAGLRYEQDHNACADARDLKNLLAVKHNGRTFLGRLLDGAEASTST